MCHFGAPGGAEEYAGILQNCFILGCVVVWRVVALHMPLKVFPPLASMTFIVGGLLCDYRSVISRTLSECSIQAGFSRLQRTHVISALDFRAFKCAEPRHSKHDARLYTITVASAQHRDTHIGAE